MSPRRPFSEIWSEINQSRGGRARLPSRLLRLILQVFGMLAASTHRVNVVQNWNRALSTAVRQ